jgi:hypothetical protein
MRTVHEQLPQRVRPARADAVIVRRGTGAVFVSAVLISVGSGVGARAEVKSEGQGRPGSHPR